MSRAAVFVFCPTRADRIQLLICERTGLMLVNKRLEGGKFLWPQVRDGVMRMSSAQGRGPSVGRIAQARDTVAGSAAASGAGRNAATGRDGACRQQRLSSGFQTG